MAIATEQSKGRRAGRPPQGGQEAPDRQGPLRRRPEASRACSTWRSCAARYAHADIAGIDTSKAKAIPGVTAVLTGDDLEFAAGVPCASNPTGDMVPARCACRSRRAACATRASPWRSCSRPTATRRPTPRRRSRSPTPAPRGRHAGGGAGRRGAQGARGARLERRARPGPQDRRRRRGVREGRGGRQAHDPKPAADPRPDRDPRRRRRLEHGLRRAHRPHLDPGTALPAHVPRDHVRRERGEGAGDRTRRRRRLRLEAEHLRRGVHRGRGVAKDRRAGQVDRGAAPRRCSPPATAAPRTPHGAGRDEGRQGARDAAHYVQTTAPTCRC